MTGLGEEVYIDHKANREAVLDELVAESQRLGLYGDAPDGVAELIEAAAKGVAEMAIGRPWPNDFHEVAADDFDQSDIRSYASAALESLGIPLSVLAAIRAGEWVAVPKVATGEMLAAARQYDYAGMIVHDPDQDDWAAHLSAAPKPPEAAR